MDGQILTKFGTVTSLGHPDPVSKQNLTWWPTAIWKIKYYDIFFKNLQISAKF